MASTWKMLFAVMPLMMGGAAQAAWPERPVTIVVPFTPGGVTDGLARITAERLQAQLKISVVVENRPGAFGAIAAEYVKRAAPDGYTLFMGSASQMVMLPNLQKVRYDPIKDFEPVSIIGSSAMVLAANLSFAPNNLAELNTYVQARPGAVAFASSGAGSASHLTMAMYVVRAQLSMLHVPYKGGAPAMADVLGGQVPMYFGTTTDVLAFTKAGRVKALAVSSAQRLPDFPGVPTVAEQGYPGYVSETWNGIVAPAGTPPAVIDTLAQALVPAKHDAAFVSKVNGIGADVMLNSPAEFKARIANDLKQWAQVIQKGNITVD
jgi:tripartite-type tricarboxylate transporter receptor subunit TctC